MKPNGALLRASRIAGGYGLSELARELEIDKSNLSKTERGLMGMSPKNLKKLSDKLAIPMNKLVPELTDSRTRRESRR